MKDIVQIKHILYKLKSIIKYIYIRKVPIGKFKSMVDQCNDDATFNMLINI